MNKFKRTLLIFILTVIAMVLTSCAHIEIVGQVDEANTASFSYSITVNTKKLDSYQVDYINESLMLLKDYWSNLGYISNIETEDDKYYLTCSISKECESTEEAFLQLFDYMTGDISPFTDLEYEYNKYYLYDEYLIKGSFDLSNIISKEIYDEYPISVSDSVDDALKDSNVTFNLILPFNGDYDTESATLKTFNHKISLNSVSKFDFNGKVNNVENSKKNKDILESRSQYHKLTFILAGLAIIFAVILTYSIIKSRQKAE